MACGTPTILQMVLSEWRQMYCVPQAMEYGIASLRSQ